MQPDGDIGEPPDIAANGEPQRFVAAGGKPVGNLGVGQQMQQPGIQMLQLRQVEAWRAAAEG